MKVDVKCWHCKKVSTLEVPSLGYARWQAGALIRSVLGKLSASDRELLISHTCAGCFDEIFRDKE